MKETMCMNMMTEPERKKRLDVMKVMILSAEKTNLNTREKKAEEMSNYIIKIIKNIHNRKDI